MRLLILALASILSLNALQAQHHEKAEHSEAHTHKEKGIYEIITSGVYSYNLDSEHGVGGVEVHFTYWFVHTWGAGGSYTARFEEEETVHDLALLFSVNPNNWLTLNIGPNFALASDHRDFALGLYTEAEINVRPTKWFHFGPILGSVISEHSEITAGMHVGFEF